ncbi:MAG: M48 family metallopeptidase [Candidatus Omnitrophota bacterium]
MSPGRLSLNQRRIRRRHGSGWRAALLAAGLVFLFQAGCASSYYNLATGREEWVFYSTDKEVSMGRSIARRLEKQFKVLQDPVAHNRVNAIGQKLAEVCDRKELLYEFKVLDLEEVNAASLPGGYVYVNRGLLEKVKSDDELAGILAHEIGHVAARHAVKRLQSTLGYTLVQALAAGTRSRDAVHGAQVALTQLFLAHARGDELLADRLAVRNMKRAGYDPYALVRVLEKLKAIHREEPTPRDYLRTHPYVSDRIRVVHEEIEGKLRFEDYLNIEEGNIQ